MQSMRLYASKLYIENDSFENLIITAIACLEILSNWKIWFGGWTVQCILILKDK